MQTTRQTRQDARTARQLAAAYRKAQEQTQTATTRQEVEEAHAAAAEIWQEARARKGKDAAVFSRLIERSY